VNITQTVLTLRQFSSFFLLFKRIIPIPTPYLPEISSRVDRTLKASHHRVKTVTIMFTAHNCINKQESVIISQTKTRKFLKNSKSSMLIDLETKN